MISACQFILKVHNLRFEWWGVSSSSFLKAWSHKKKKKVPNCPKKSQDHFFFPVFVLQVWQCDNMCVTQCLCVRVGIFQCVCCVQKRHLGTFLFSSGFVWKPHGVASCRQAWFWGWLVSLTSWHSAVLQTPAHPPAPPTTISHVGFRWWSDFHTLGCVTRHLIKLASYLLQ